MTQSRAVRAIVRTDSGGGHRIVRFILRALSLLTGLTWGLAAYYTPILAVSHVEIQGTEVLDGNHIVEDVDIWGESLLALDIASVARRVESEPWVKSVVIRRYLPGKVVLAVEERRAELVWRVGEESFLIDREGVVLGKEGAVNAVLPIVQLGAAALQPGQQVDSDAVGLVLTLEQLLPQELGVQAIGFEYLSPGDLVVLTDQGWTASFGHSDGLEYKLAVLRAVLPEIAEACPEGNHIDLRFENRPLFRCV